MTYILILWLTGGMISNNPNLSNYHGGITTQEMQNKDRCLAVLKLLKEQQVNVGGVCVPK